MHSTTDDLRIRQIRPLPTPHQVINDLPQSSLSTRTVIQGRHAVSNIVSGRDDRLAVIVGPCSVHDPKAAMDYAHLLQAAREKHASDLEIIMRVYFAKPRTTVGWKGLINDPHLDGSFAIEEGLHVARKLLLDVNALGLPAGCELLDIIAPQYLSDLISWGAIGARTTESQIHRELASGLSYPIGFKNGTDGSVRIAVAAVKAASKPHHFLAVTKDGQSAIAETSGNADCHIILRGGEAPNYQASEVRAAAQAMQEAGLSPRIMIDASHANSGYVPAQQPQVMADVGAQIAAGDRTIIGVMIESNLVEGRQDCVDPGQLRYGQSITDSCIDWPTTDAVLDQLADAIRRRRAQFPQQLIA